MFFSFFHFLKETFYGVIVWKPCFSHWKVTLEGAINNVFHFRHRSDLSAFVIQPVSWRQGVVPEKGNSVSWHWPIRLLVAEHINKRHTDCNVEPNECGSLGLTRNRIMFLCIISSFFLFFYEPKVSVRLSLVCSHLTRSSESRLSLTSRSTTGQHFLASANYDFVSLKTWCWWIINSQFWAGTFHSQCWLD